MKLKEIIVVEGKHDTQKLKSFFDVDTIETNGMFLSNERLELIKLLNEKRGVILFLDPDTPGTKIRNRINAYIPNLKNAFIDKKKCRTSKKVGIEHAEKEDLEASLNHLVTFTKEDDATLLRSEYIELGFEGQANSKKLRYHVGQLLFLGDCNAKTLYKRLNMFKITKTELEKLIEETYE